MRIRKLVDPSLQLRLALWFLATAGVGLVFQYLLITDEVSSLVLDLPGDTAKNYQAFLEATRNTLVMSLLVILPLTLGVAILTTFQLAGPVYRFQEFLKRIASGEKPADCVIRKGDELHELCRLLNDVTRPLRVQGQAAEPKDGSGELRRVA